MSCSLAQVTQLTCPACSVEFVTELWLIVDTAERGDLFQALTADTIHDIHCPHCGHIGRVDAPLLVYHTVHTTANRVNRFGPIYTKPVRRVFYFPPLNSSQSADEAFTLSLLNVLRDRLGDDWKTLEGSALLAMPRPLLALALAGDPQAVQARIRGKVAIHLGGAKERKSRRQNHGITH